MARFGSRHANYGHGVQVGRYMVLATGERQEVRKHLQAKFRKGILSEQEEDFCISFFNHPGLPEDRDTEGLFSPRFRISGFDSYAAQEYNDWTDDERELVESALRKSPHYGEEFVELTAQPALKPWPLYEQAPDGATVVSVAQAIGVSLADVLAYEQENANRKEVVETLKEAIAGPQEDEEEPLLIEA